MGPLNVEWAAIAPPIVFDCQETVETYAELILSVHDDIESDSGCFSPPGNARYRLDVLGRLEAVVGNTFVGYFGIGPLDRFDDIFDQAAYLASHLAQDHIFLDGNKRTALVMALSLPTMRGVTFNYSDGQNPEGNDPYEWIQKVVSRVYVESDLAFDLRKWAQSRQ